MLGRTQRTGSDLSKNVSLVTVLTKDENPKGAEQYYFSQLGQGPPLASVTCRPAILSWTLPEGMAEPYLSGSKMGWRQGPSTAAWSFQLKSKVVLRCVYESHLGPRQEARESACGKRRLSQQVDRLYQWVRKKGKRQPQGLDVLAEGGQSALLHS